MDQLILEGLKLLVVDDDRDSRELLLVALEGDGAEVVIVESVRDAMISLQQRTPDVLISDIRMPDESGYHLIAQVQQLETELGISIPAIAVTAFARSNDRADCLTAGFRRHFSKPVDLDELSLAIAQVAGRFFQS